MSDFRGGGIIDDLVDETAALRARAEAAEARCRDYEERDKRWADQCLALSAKLATARREALEEAAGVADYWASWYPLDVFPKVEIDYSAELTKTTVSRISGGMGRHVSEGIAKDIRALAEAAEARVEQLEATAQRGWLAEEKVRAKLATLRREVLEEAANYIETMPYNLADVSGWEPAHRTGVEDAAAAVRALADTKGDDK